MNPRGKRRREEQELIGLCNNAVPPRTLPSQSTVSAVAVLASGQYTLEEDERRQGHRPSIEALEAGLPLNIPESFVSWLTLRLGSFKL